MPFKSKAQIAKFRAMERAGEISRGTTKRWLSHTPAKGKYLPTKKKSAKK